MDPGQFKERKKENEEKKSDIFSNAQVSQILRKKQNKILPLLV